MVFFMTHFIPAGADPSEDPSAIPALGTAPENASVSQMVDIHDIYSPPTGGSQGLSPAFYAGTERAESGLTGGGGYNPAEVTGNYN